MTAEFKQEIVCGHEEAPGVMCPATVKWRVILGVEGGQAWGIYACDIHKEHDESLDWIPIEAPAWRYEGWA